MGINTPSRIRTVLTPPHGDSLAQLLADPRRALELKQASRDFPSWDLTARQLCDLDCLITGVYSPLTGFLGQADYVRVLREMRLADGRLWPIPVVLDVPQSVASAWDLGQGIALRDPEGTMIAVLTLAERWQPDKAEEARLLYGTASTSHPEVEHLYHGVGEVYVAGRLEAVQRPPRYDFAELRRTPAEMRRLFVKQGISRVLGYHTREPLHRAHVEFSAAAAQRHDAGVLIQAEVGQRRAGEALHFARVRSYAPALAQYPAGMARLNLIEHAGRQCGPREALWNAIIAKNYGCSHFVVAHDHHATGPSADGRPLYGQYRTQEWLGAYAEELGIDLVVFRGLIPEEDRPHEFLSGRGPVKAAYGVGERTFRELRQRNIEIASWFSYPAVLQELSRTLAARDRQGYTVFFTGLSGSGKSTIANVLLARLMEADDRPVTLLDGDIVRRELSAGLGFSREDRDRNVARIGYVASLITKNHGIAVCAPIAPYRDTRARVRAMVEAYGGFIEVYIATPLEVCEGRDRKGLYAKARAGKIEAFTGVSDPYEAPVDPEIMIDTRELSAQEAADRIVGFLVREGYMNPPREPALEVGQPEPPATYAGAHGATLGPELPFSH